MSDARADSGHPAADIQCRVRDRAGRQFVRRYIWLGSASSVSAILGVVVYLLMTPQGGHRGVLFGVLAMAFLTAAAAILLSGHVVETRWERPFFTAWVAATMLIILVLAVLDRQPESPLRWLLVLPVVYTAMDYPLSHTVAVAGTALFGALALSVIDNEWDAEDCFRILFVATFDVMAVASAVIRRSYERAEQDLITVATHDGLTGCLNGATFHARLLEESSRADRSGRPYSIIAVDADKFKHINDTFGHLAGDEVLARIGATLIDTMRVSDAVARTGGDEFVVLLPDTDSVQAAAMGRRLLAEVRDARGGVAFTVSVGIATWQGDADPLAVMRRADIAMYEAKRAGGDRAVALPPAAARVRARPRDQALTVEHRGDKATRAPSCARPQTASPLRPAAAPADRPVDILHTP